ncbi:hypothetical protein ACFJIS_20190 [Variovorax boronicumulans]|uniref:hypothetical protein n=1 Tax=Variovorax boronicumulans TaxID=436515 RepID=UPI0036F3FC5C
MNTPLFADLAAWIDSVLSAPLPEGIAAFHFNLYDSSTTYDLELVGAPTYDPEDPDWACDDIFMSSSPRFEIASEAVGPDWEAGLQAISQMILRYLDAASAGAARLKASRAVSLGFVDGDLHLVWRAD